MKRIIVFWAFALLSASALMADPVSRQKALDVAKVVLMEDPTALDIQEADGLYVVNRRSGGFVLVSANDNARPVLGFSLENSFPMDRADMPANVRRWLDYIRGYCRSEAVATKEVEQEWAEYAEYADTKALPMASITDEFKGSRSVEWNQSAPANLLCPQIPGEADRSVAGCVPLAFAEVLTWFGYPEKGKGDLPSYSFTVNGNNIEMEGYSLGTVYDWAGLQQLKTPTQFYECQDPVRSNLAQLVYDCGFILQAEYSYSGTAATDYGASALFGQYMGYNKEARLISLDEYIRAEWEEILESQVAQHPVIYSGFDGDSGHCYLVDGYATYKQTDRVFHFNFGWGGYGNGYYYAQYQDSGNGNWGEGLSALIDFYPDPQGTSVSPKELSYTSGGSYTGIRLEGGQLKPGSSCSVSIRFVMNSGDVDFDGHLYAVLEDRNGQMKERYLIYDFSANPLPPGYYYTKLSGTCELSSGLSLGLGDHLRAYYSTDGGVTMQPVSGRLYTLPFLDEYPVFPAANILKESSYSVGDWFKFILINTDYIYDTTVWTITDPSGKSSEYQQAEGCVRLTQEGEYKIVAKTPYESITAYIVVQ